MLGIEPYMIPQDYTSEEAFFRKLNSYLSIARGESFLGEKTIVLFPEYVGTWLVLAGESETLLKAATLESAQRTMVSLHPVKFLSYVFRSPEKGKAQAAFFRMKAAQMAEIYQQVFSRLAQQYAATIIAGSIVLPAPQITAGRLVVTNGSLYNVSAVYGPEGAARPPVIRKAFPTARELPFTTPASASDTSSFHTPAGNLGVLICADSWFPQAHGPLKEQEIDLLAVPSYDLFGMQIWNQPWKGYDGWRPPVDVDPNDIEKITEAQAWKKYSLAGRIRSSGATYGMNVFLRGKLWDQDLGGWPATLVRGEEVFVEEPTQKAAILSLWL
jgi:predicted amidohydrolase